MTPRVYTSPAAFKQALEQRLRDASMTGKDFARRRQRLVFERFMARVESLLGSAAVLKGGLVLELRMERARTTKDIDLRVVGSAEGILERVQRAGQIALGDFMAFEVQPDPQHPTIQNEAMKYDGLRYRVTCRLAGKIYGETFGVDVAFADPILGEPDIVTAPDTLAFAGIAAPSLRVYPIESHVAEKLHAYTMPREAVMAQSEHLPIYKRGYELCLHLEQVARGFSRSNRALGDELRTGSRRALSLVVRANSRREREPELLALYPPIQVTIPPLASGRAASTCGTSGRRSASRFDLQRRTMTAMSKAGRCCWNERFRSTVTKTSASRAASVRSSPLVIAPQPI